MVNIALAIGFAVASLFSPGRRLLALFVDGPVFQSLAPYQGHLLTAFASYLVPAVLAYVLLRLSHAERWLRPRPAIHVLLGLGNVALILYVSMRTLASTVQGGGASFAVLQLAPLIIFPAWALLAVGLVWLLVRSFRTRPEGGDATARSWGAGETIGVTVVLGVPLVGLAWTLYLSSDAPFRLAREAERAFQQRCATAGQKFYGHPQDVQSIYLDRDGGSYFENIVDGIYGAHGGGILGEPLVNSGFLLYFEKPNDRQRQDGSTAKYRRHGFRDWKGEPLEELTSEFGVFQRSLVTEEEKKLGLSGTEVTVKGLRSEQVIASAVVFTSSRHRAICGHAGNTRFAVSDFGSSDISVGQ